MRVLVVEDDTISRKIVAAAVTELGHDCTEAVDGEGAWKLLQEESFDVIVSDWFMPAVDGLELCRRVRKMRTTHYVYFILLTVASGEGHAAEAMEAGVDDFLQKPLDPEGLRVRLIVAERVTKLQHQVRESEERLTVLEEQARMRKSFAGMVGSCAAMQEVFRRLRLAGESDVSVLIQGESGTGKELAATAIHELSARKSGPFIAVNCAAVPDSVLESELFGHVRGAFTDAHRDKTGLFELADKGTLFLDEIGDVSPLLQKKMLRVLEERQVRPVGGEEERAVDVRVVTATNKSLASMVENGEFRQDLYYRIRVFPIELPPLRERREDLPLLVEHFRQRLHDTTGKGVTEIDSEAMRLLLAHDWPGNIRELRNAIEHGFVTVQGASLRAQDLPVELRARPSGRGAVAGAEGAGTNTASAEESDLVIDTVRRCGGNRSQAARELGISRVALWKKIRKLGIEDQLPPTRMGKGASSVRRDS